MCSKLKQNSIPCTNVVVQVNPKWPTFTVVHSIACHFGRNTRGAVNTSNLICLTLGDFALNFVFAVFAVVKACDFKAKINL